ncbi:SAV_2336 N-terminal domain-related protein [Nocardia sp. NPDC046763]|uniref:SAV_2336 N-terminal domain-related protein n=1 Tax=Nocardia sp. NPDC046763 TaxID=3155256 RepID=UPI0033D6A5E0
MGSLSELLEALRGLEMDPDQVAEALWLAKHIEDQPAAATPSPPPPTEAPEAEPISPIPATSPPDLPVAPRAAPAASPGRTYGWPFRAEIEVSAPAPLDSELRLLGEFRPLGQRLPDPDQREFDEDATVQRSASTGVAWPVTRPALVRRREAALVFDRHPSMVAWGGLARAVRELVEKVGFRQVRVWYLDEDAEGALRLATGAREPADRALSELYDASGSRVIMVFSACLGDAWQWGTAAAELQQLSKVSPVAVIQPLPSSIWSRTGLNWEQGRITPVILNCPSPLRVVAPAGSGPMPVPVLEMTPGWIAPWTDLLTGRRRAAGFPLLSSPASDPDRSRTLAARQNAELGNRPLERVRRFRSASSPDAFRLAASLAQVPLLLPIMRLVQRAVLPGTRATVLAEVLAGGLIEEATETSAPPYTIPEDSRVFVFRQEVAAILRDALPRSEATGVLNAVSQFIETHYDVPGKVFRATVSEPSSGGGAPFAYLSPETLRRIAPSFPDPPTEPPDEDDRRRYDAVLSDAVATVALDDPDLALTRCRYALASVPMGYAPRITVLHSMTRLLRVRWERFGDTSDLDEAIAVAKTALTEMPDAEDDPEFVAELGGLLFRRYSAVGGVDFLIDSTRVLRIAVEAMEPHGRLGVQVSDQLGDALVLRCEVAAEPLYAWEAIDRYRVAAEGADESRGPVLLLKLARARLDVVVLSAYPDPTVVEQLLEDFRYAAPQLTDAGIELSEATREFVRRVESGAATGRLETSLMHRLVGILRSALPGLMDVVAEPGSALSAVRALLELAPPEAEPGAR